MTGYKGWGVGGNGELGEGSRVTSRGHQGKGGEGWLARGKGRR